MAIVHKGTGDVYFIFCPACKRVHKFDATWGFNGDMNKPSLHHSILCHNGNGVPPYKCHSIITNGRITYCDDCTHDLKNQTLDLLDF